MKIKIIQRGTHILPISDINKDVPNPASLVADCLADLQYSIAELIRTGGVHDPNDTTTNHIEHAKNSLHFLTYALHNATEQNWKLELDPNP